MILFYLMLPVFYLYLHDLCVSCVCLAVCFNVFYVYMGQVPEIKLMMIIIILPLISDSY